MEKKKETNKNNETTHKKPVKREFKTNARNAVSMNNGSIVKLEKEIAKKNALQRKL
jgi:dephospho-CoA kinase